MEPIHNPYKLTKLIKILDLTSQLYLCVNQLDGKYYHCYAIRTRNIDKAKQQVEMLGQIRHPNLPKYVCCFEAMLKRDKQKELKSHICIIVQFIKGNLLSDSSYFLDQRTERIEERLAETIQYLHSHNISHKNINTDNIYLNHGNLVLANFGINVYEHLFNTPQQYINRDWCNYYEIMKVLAHQGYKVTNLNSGKTTSYKTDQKKQTHIVGRLNGDSPLILGTSELFIFDKIKAVHHNSLKIIVDPGTQYNLTLLKQLRTNQIMQLQIFGNDCCFENGFDFLMELHELRRLKLSNCYKLSILHLDSFTLEYLESLEFCKYTEIQSINLNGSQLKELYLNSEYSFKSPDLVDLQVISKLNLQLLEKLQILNKGIKRINYLSQHNLIHLQTLNLSQNKIDDISVLSMNSFQNVVTLRLANNNIHNIDVLEKALFTQLKSLDLAANKIQCIQQFSRCNFPQLEELSIFNNNFLTIDFFQKSNFVLKLAQLHNKIHPIHINLHSLLKYDLKSISTKIVMSRIANPNQVLTLRTNHQMLFVQVITRN